MRLTYLAWLLVAAMLAECGGQPPQNTPGQSDATVYYDPSPTYWPLTGSTGGVWVYYGRAASDAPEWDGDFRIDIWPNATSYASGARPSCSVDVAVRGHPPITLPVGLTDTCQGCTRVDQIALETSILDHPCLRDDPALQDWASHLGGHFLARDGATVYTDIPPGVFSPTHFIR